MLLDVLPHMSMNTEQQSRHLSHNPRLITSKHNKDIAAIAVSNLVVNLVQLAWLPL